MGRACGLQKLFQARTALHRECKLIMEGKNKVMGVQEENANQVHRKKSLLQHCSLLLIRQYLLMEKHLRLMVDGVLIKI